MACSWQSYLLSSVINPSHPFFLELSGQFKILGFLNLQFKIWMVFFRDSDAVLLSVCLEFFGTHYFSYFYKLVCIVIPQKQDMFLKKLIKIR
jgi:hypothetical protein